MYKIPLWSDREVCVYGKEDGNALEKDHVAHTNFFSVTQTHSNGIFIVENDEFRPGKLPHEADALFTIHDKPLGVYVADCLPIILVGNNAHAIVHGSWRTLHDWLLQETLELFHNHNDIIVAAYIWPSIKHYEVGEEFENYFPDAFLEPYGEKYLLNLPWYVLSILDAWWISHEAIVIDPWCTWNDTQKYWGYRKGDKDERNFIGVRKI